MNFASGIGLIGLGIVVGCYEPLLTVHCIVTAVHLAWVAFFLRED